MPVTRFPALAVLVAGALVIAACGSDDDTTDSGAASTEETSSTTAAADPEPEAEEPAAVAKPTIAVTGVSFSTNTVTVRNDGDSDVSLDGFFLCNRPTYIGAPAVTIAPGTTADIDVTDLALSNNFGEFGLYSSSDFGSSDAIVAYVQWGQGENGRASVAVDAGLIAEGEFIDNGGEDFSVG